VSGPARAAVDARRFRGTVVQVNTRDREGGAARVALDLHRTLLARGTDAWLAVGERTTDGSRVVELTPGAGRSPVGRAWRRAVDAVAGVGRAVDGLRGIESFRYPASRRLPERVPSPPDVVHAHNLHGGYFDLRELGSLSRRVPVVLTLHDAWLLSGHCAHSLGCDRWESGCGACPDLSIYPALRRDGTAGNWRRKAEIYRGSRLRVATPCAWLMERVERSMLGEGVVESRVIPNGVDRSVFRPGDPGAARRALGLPAEAYVLLFVASGLGENAFKDPATLRSALERVAAGVDGREVVCVAVGAEGAAAVERVGGATLRVLPFERDREAIARRYRAADLYVHAARAETFPLTILEALACGTPVVASAVGGVPEQIRSLPAGGAAARPTGSAARPTGSATGVLVPPGDADALAAAVVRLLEDPALRARLGENAARDAARRFDLDDQCDAYEAWYGAIVAERRGGAHVS